MKTLYTQYRPKNFAEIYGQEIVKKILINSFQRKELHHSYLFNGIRGVGKTTLARIFAKLLNCKNPINNEPCNKCESCDSINNFSSLSVFEIDAASNNGVSEIREIIDKLNYQITDNYKIYIIDEFHMLSKAAFNALLKTLEEPPKNTIFMLLTTELNKIPETIISRSLLLNLNLIENKEIMKIIEDILISENIPYDKKAINYIVEIARGSIRDALSILQSVILYDKNVDIKNTTFVLGILEYEILEEMFSNNITKLIEFIDKNSSINIQNFAVVLIQFLMNNVSKHAKYSVLLENLINFEFRVKDPVFLKQLVKNEIRKIADIKTLKIQEKTIEKVVEEKIENAPLIHEIVQPTETIEEVKSEQPKEQGKVIENNNETQLALNEETNVSRETLENKSITNAKVGKAHLEEETKEQKLAVKEMAQKDITKFLTSEMYLTIFKFNNNELAKNIREKWIFLTNYMEDKHFSKYVSVLQDAKIAAAYKQNIIIGFSEKIYYTNFKSFSLEPNFFKFIEVFLGSKYILMPIYPEIYTKIKNILNDDAKIANINFKEPDFELILSEVNNYQNMGKLLFGDKLFK